MITVTGKLIDIGMLEGPMGVTGRGILLESEGQEIALTGLSEGECRLLAPFVCQRIYISAGKVNDPPHELRPLLDNALRALEMGVAIQPSSYVHEELKKILGSPSTSISSASFPETK